MKEGGQEGDKEGRREGRKEIERFYPWLTHSLNAATARLGPG